MPDLLTEQECADLLGVEPRTVRLWRHTRGLPYLKLTAKVIRFRKPDIERWLEKHCVATVASFRSLPEC